MKALIYGLNGYREIVEKSLKHEIEIYYSDSFASIKSFNDCQFVKPSNIIEYNFDIIIIAIRDRAIAYQIKKYIMEIGNTSSYIFWFGELYNRVYGQKVDKVLAGACSSPPTHTKELFWESRMLFVE